MTREEALEVMWKNLPSDKNLPVYEALQTLIPELRPKFKAGDIIAHNTICYEPDHFIVSVDDTGYNTKDGFIGFGVQDEYTLVGRFNPNPTDMDDMDKECIGICKLLNSLPTIQTFESCSGHLKDRFSVWFFCDSIEVLSRLGRAVEHNYSDGKWEVVVDSTDTHPYGVYWLRSKSPFQNYEEMNESLQSLIANIRHWFKDEFDSYFIKPEDTAPVRLEEEDGEKYPVVDYKLMEQKPVEIDKEINRWMGCEAFPEGTNITPLPQAMEIVERTAKHFFELGEKTVPFPGGYREGFNAGVRECQAKIRDAKGAMKEQEPINESNMHEPTLDEARKWNEAYEKGYSLGYENGRNEQKPVSREEWNDGKSILEDIIVFVSGYADKRVVAKWVSFLKSLRPQLKHEWSEEDERIRKKLIEYFSHYKEDREWWEGITPRNIISYLEMQKPSFRQIHDGIMWDSGLRTGIELEKKEKGKNTQIALKGWVARDKGGEISLYKAKPIRSTKADVWDALLCDTLLIDRTAFPDLTWKDEPLKVVVQLVKDE